MQERMREEIAKEMSGKVPDRLSWLEIGRAHV